MSMQFDFLPATFSPIPPAVSPSAVPTVDFKEYVNRPDADTSLIPPFFDKERGEFRHDAGLEGFKSSLKCWGPFTYDRHMVFADAADVLPVCYADALTYDFNRRPSIGWLFDVFSGTMKLFFTDVDSSILRDAFFLYSYGTLSFYVRQSSLMWDNLNKKWNFVDNLRPVHNEDGEVFYVPLTVDDDHLVCENCGEFIFADGAEGFIEMKDGTLFCSADCAIECGYTQCENCGEWCSQDEAVWVEDRQAVYCDDCANTHCFTCPNCENVYDVRYLSGDIETSDGAHFCSSECAVDSGYTMCEDCEGWFPDSDIYYSERRGVYLCESCYDEDEENAVPDVIHSYGYKPDYHFNAMPEEKGQKNLYFGVEIETEYEDRTDFIEALTSLDDISKSTNEMIYLKSDGSLSDDGVEIVTMPCTLSYLKSDAGKEIFSNVFNVLESADPSTSAGTHVHISRAGFTDGMSVRLELFFMRAADLCQKICGRGSVHYARYDLDRDVKDLSLFTPRHCDYRYRCINWNNDRTVEIRAFSAITTLEEFYKNVEFCHAVYQFVKSGETYNFQFSDIKDAFILFIEREKDRYEHLYHFISTEIL